MKKTVAEFVGDAGTTPLLRESGVGQAQGYPAGLPRATTGDQGHNQWDDFIRIELRENPALQNM